MNTITVGNFKQTPQAPSKGEIWAKGDAYYLIAVNPDGTGRLAAINLSDGNCWMNPRTTDGFRFIGRDMNINLTPITQG